ncbi:hypothetical protein GCM10011343_17420 [Flavobacterium orientale]|uniref:Uncharacterized protein n=1 Tax=Flavobacterium orientale TaxID=1756020 RepID=A0A916Y2L4_9FLAO|nr:hypothetical protein GCM10011343_17420 [Flavobacterium orientale]
MLLNSCYFPSYRAVAETGLYDISFTEGKWFLNYVTIDGKPFSDFSNYSEKELQNCLNDSLYLSYGKRKSIYNVPILTAKNSKESLSLLRATNTIDYVIQITGSIGDNDISGINIKPMKNAEKSTASITFKVYEVATEKIIYSHTTSGEIVVENNREDVLFGKSTQTILKKCLEKGMTQFKKSGGCR